MSGKLILLSRFVAVCFIPPCTTTLLIYHHRLPIMDALLEREKIDNDIFIDAFLLSKPACLVPGFLLSTKQGVAVCTTLCRYYLLFTYLNTCFFFI